MMPRSNKGSTVTEAENARLIVLTDRLASETLAEMSPAALRRCWDTLQAVAVIVFDALHPTASTSPV